MRITIEFTKLAGRGYRCVVMNNKTVTSDYCIDLANMKLFVSSIIHDIQTQITGFLLNNNNDL